jgi:hypothetical protein
MNRGGGLGESLVDERGVDSEDGRTLGANYGVSQEHNSSHGQRRHPSHYRTETVLNSHITRGNTRWYRAGLGVMPGRRGFGQNAGQMKSLSVVTSRFPTAGSHLVMASLNCINMSGKRSASGR